MILPAVKVKGAFSHVTLLESADWLKFIDSQDYSISSVCGFVPTHAVVSVPQSPWCSSIPRKRPFLWGRRAVTLLPGGLQLLLPTILYAILYATTWQTNLPLVLPHCLYYHTCSGGWTMGTLLWLAWRHVQAGRAVSLWTFFSLSLGISTISSLFSHWLQVRFI